MAVQRKVAQVLIAAMLLAPTFAVAQTWRGCLGDAPFAGGYLENLFGLTNGVINIFTNSVGQVTWGNDADDSTGDPEQNYNFSEEGCFDPTISADGSGRFAFGYSSGSEQTTADDDCAVTFGYPFAGGDWCYATIRVIEGETTTDKVFGEGTSWRLSPYIGASGAYIRGLWDFGGPNVWVDLRIDVLGDTWRFQWDFYNFTENPVQIGMRFGHWTAMRKRAPGQFVNGDRRGFLDNLYVLIPGLRPRSTDYIADRTAVGTAQFPPYFDVYWGQSDPYPSFRHWLKPDPGHPDLTIADRIEFMSVGRLLQGVQWNGFTVPDLPVVNPSYAVFHNPINVPVNVPGDLGVRPGRRIVQYMSSANAASNIEVPVAVTTEAPRALQFDPSSPNSVAPSPFTISALVANGYSVIDREVDLTNVSVLLSLPPGLSVAPGETLQKIIPRIAAGRSTTVKWNVVADGTVNGIVEYRVIVSPPPANAKTVTNRLFIPAVNKMKVTDGYDMVALPFVFSDTRFESIFGTPGLRTIGVDPTTGRYIPVANAVRGEGIWLDAGEDTVFTLQGASAPPGQVTSDFKINLEPGWRMIGNPWLYPIPFGQLVFVGADDPSQARSLEEAIGLGWIRGVLYRWDKALGEYTFTEDLTTPIEPARGYWVRITATRPLDVIWPPVFTVGVGGSPRAAGLDAWTPRPGHFRLQVAARSNGSADTKTFFGVTENASVGLDRYDVPKPPAAPEGRLRVAIENNDWGPDSGPYAQDIRPASDREATWFFTVTSDRDGEVTLTWPNLSQLPKDVGFRLTDLQTGAVRNLRNVSAYTFQMTEGQRRFKLEMTPAAPSRVMITSLNVTQTRGVGGVNVQYSLSADATTTVRILSASGQVVRTLSTGRAESRGVQQHVWDTRDASGVSMPPGTYVIEVAAITEDGQVARVVRPHVLTR
ncbi:MAG: hypothetical protein HRF45_11385 [Fimbriimonadia bacterium]|jgi:hypothetical protein